jgi:DNA helicase HerA-like ATPase
MLIWPPPVESAVDEVGRIYGDVGLGRFQLNLAHPVERGDYLTVVDELHGSVLCQLDDLHRTSDLDVDRADELGHGAPTMVHERLVGLARVIGYRDDQGLVKVPTIPFRPGAQVFRAEEGLIAGVLGLGRHTAVGAYVGLLRGHGLRIELDINQLVQRHVSVLAKTGGGKSYLLGVLIEELLRHKVTCVIIDPHGEYGSLREAAPKNGVHAKFKVEVQGFGNRIQEYSPDPTLNPKAKPLTFSLKNLDPRELLIFMGLTNVKSFLAPLKTLLEEAAGRSPDYSIKDLVDLASRHEEPQYQALHERLEYVEQTRLLAPHGTKLEELVRKGDVTLINLRGVAPDVQELVVARISGTIFDNRKKNKIPPLFLVIEEAHNFAPQQGSAASSRVLKNIAAEGRKFGLGLCIVTQRAARIDKSVLSQCNTQLILQVTNPLDLKAIAQSIEGLTEGMTEMIQSLPVGVALVTGGGYHTPLFCEVRPRATRHGGESIRVVEN